MTVRYDDVEVGTELPAQTFDVQRVNLVMYAGASGDFNPSDRARHVHHGRGSPGGHGLGR